jgi:hypothetical protein
MYTFWRANCVTLTLLYKHVYSLASEMCTLAFLICMFTFWRTNCVTLTTIEERGVVGLFWAKDMEAKDIHKEMLPIWETFLCGYPLLPYFMPTKKAQHHAVLSWYMYSGAPPSYNSYYVCTFMRIPIVVRHNKTR